MGFNDSADTGLTASHYVRYNTATNINYKTGKVNFFGNYGYNGGNNYNYGFVNRPDANRLQDFIFKNNNKSNLIKLGADIYLNKKNTLSFYTTKNWFIGGGDGRTIVSQNRTILANFPSIQLQENQTEAYNINYKREFKKEEHNIEFETTYSKTKSPEDAKTKNLLTNANDISYKALNFTNEIERKRNNTLLNLDYTNPISKEGKLELGIEYRADNKTNVNLTDQEIENFDTNGNSQGFSLLGNSDFEYDQKILSGYVNYGHKFGKLTMQLGARLE